MSAPKHTPGPWAAEINTTDGARIYAAGDFGQTVAWVNPDRINEQYREELSAEGVANARLVAAAPELLEACEAALISVSERYFTYVLDCGEQAADATVIASLRSALHAAIAKARGQ